MEPLRPTVLVAGATGALGRHVVAALRARAYPVRALTRDPARAARLLGLEPAALVRADALVPATLRGAADGAAVVFSCAGASVQPSLGHGRRSFTAVDHPANANLLAEARRAG